VSLIWSISRDVLSSIWSMPAKRLLGIFLRLSVVVGVIVAGATFASMYIRHRNFVDNQIEERLKLHYALRCAQRLSDDILLRHEEKPAGRNIDLSKVGCSDSTYWTNLFEIRAAPEQPRIPTETFDVIYRLNVDPVAAVAGGILSMVLVNVLSLLLVLLRGIAMWIIGTERA